MYRDFSEKPDVIVMAYRMAIIKGIDASKEILESDSRVKMIFASADDSVKEAAFSIGAISSKTKPFSNDKILRNINKALNSEIIH